jgi:hypothetical protein
MHGGVARKNPVFSFEILTASPQRVKPDGMHVPAFGGLLYVRAWLVNRAVRT